MPKLTYVFCFFYVKLTYVDKDSYKQDTNCGVFPFTMS